MLRNKGVNFQNRFETTPDCQLLKGGGATNVMLGVYWKLVLHWFAVLGKETTCSFKQLNFVKT